MRNYYLIKFVILLLLSVRAISQTCPPNIGFEEGNFNHWEGWTGTASEMGPAPSAFSLLDGRHTMYSKTMPALDPYGNFPVICPNGSGYSIKLGNLQSGGEAEGINYTFTIPVGQTKYSIIFNYAVVFQNPNHRPDQQPKFTCKIYNVTDDRYIDCGSFEFISSGDLPGFQSAGNNVFFKTWSPVTLNLTGYEGKIIRLEFATLDCTLGGHFGYAYIDVNENCTEPISGNYVCPGTGFINLTAPFGYGSYEWYTADFSTLIGTGNPIKISPPPPVNTVYAVVINPYLGLGCIDTLYTTIKPIDVPFVLNVIDKISGCTSGVNIMASHITAGSTPDMILSYFTDVGATIILPDPTKIKNSGTYYIRGVNPTGCNDIKPIDVFIIPDPVFTITEPPPAKYPSVTVDITTSVDHTNGLFYTYWLDSLSRMQIPDPTSIGKRGRYFIKGTNREGCYVIKGVNVAIVPPPDPLVYAPNAFTPNNDGLNDIFKIKIMGETSVMNFKIYNRWGQVVYDNINMNTGWNGKLNGQDVPQGVYIWIVNGFDDYFKKPFSQKGLITLVR